MSSAKYLILAALLVVLTGCAAIFGRSTDDPALKLSWASEYFGSQDDPISAEPLIREAVEIYEKQNDQLGLAEAYRQYGLFFRSNAVGKFEKHYRKKGFLDKTTLFEERYTKAIEYFKKSRDIFTLQKRFEDLSNIYISIARTYAVMNRQEEACDAFNNGLKSHASFREANPEESALRSEETAKFEEYIGEMKKQVGCQ